LTLHFSGTLLGSARGTGLLPVCGRNLYNCLCSFFLCSFHLSAALRLWTHSDSELFQTLNLRTVFQNVRKKFSKTQFNPPFLWFFSPSNNPLLLEAAIFSAVKSWSSKGNTSMVWSQNARLTRKESLGMKRKRVW